MTSENLWTLFLFDTVLYQLTLLPIQVCWPVSALTVDIIFKRPTYFKPPTHTLRARSFSRIESVSLRRQEKPISTLTWGVVAFELMIHIGTWRLKSFLRHNYNFLSQIEVCQLSPGVSKVGSYSNSCHLGYCIWKWALLKGKRGGLGMARSKAN